MSEFITRRSFIKGSTALGASSILGASAVGWMQELAFAEGEVDIAAVKGTDYFKNTIKSNREERGLAVGAMAVTSDRSSSSQGRLRISHGRTLAASPRSTNQTSPRFE